MTEIFQSLKQRMPWSVARVVLRTVGVETGQGWDRTIEKYADKNLDGISGPLLDAVGSVAQMALRDSSRESRVIAGGHEQTEHTDLQDAELARV
jgi:hypothetical protein